MAGRKKKDADAQEPQESTVTETRDGVRCDIGKLTIPKPPRTCIEVEVEFAPELIGLLHEYKKRMIGIGYEQTQYLPGMEGLGKVLKENAKGTQASIILAFPDTPEILAELQNLKHENDRTVWLFSTDKPLPGDIKSETEDLQDDLDFDGEEEDADIE